MTIQQLGEQTQKFLAAGRQRPELATSSPHLIQTIRR